MECLLVWVIGDVNVKRRFSLQIPCTSILEKHWTSCNRTVPFAVIRVVAFTHDMLLVLRIAFTKQLPMSSM